MASYVFTAWFRNLEALPDDQDYEWPACFIIDSEDPESALVWGKHLAKNFSSRHSKEEFLSAGVEVATTQDITQLPRVRVGDEVDDEYIGW